jgi:hypothetical protein
MSSQLQIVTKLDPTTSSWIIQATIVAGGTVPKDIFIYENDGSTDTIKIENYIGVCDLDEYQRLQTFTGTAIPVFSNRYVKYTMGQLKLSSGTSPAQAISIVQTEVTALSTALNSAQSSTQIINIP